jgi:hypothetical protein
MGVQILKVIRHTFHILVKSILLYNMNELSLFR